MENQEFKNFKGKKCLFTAFFIILSLFLVTLIISTAVGVQNKIKEGRYIGQEVEAKNTITVSATGEVYAKPDLVLLDFSIVNEAKTVVEAMAENTEKMNKVIDFMKNQGIEEKDLKTTSFNIYPRYKWRNEIYYYPSGERVLVGYEVRQSLEIKIRDMEKIGDIIEGATTAGANQIGSLEFTIDKQDELKKQAREQAIELAETKAKEITSQLGVRIERITNFNESSVSPRFYALENEAMALPSGAGGETLQIETGESKISITVSITYEIR
ncbi:SIMPL domain-containing protein [Patescibacteria group bacterium]